MLDLGQRCAQRLGAQDAGQARPVHLVVNARAVDATRGQQALGFVKAQRTRRDLVELADLGNAHQGIGTVVLFIVKRPRRRQTRLALSDLGRQCIFGFGFHRNHHDKNHLLCFSGRHGNGPGPASPVRSQISEAHLG